MTSPTQASRLEMGGDVKQASYKTGKRLICCGQETVERGATAITASERARAATIVVFDRQPPIQQQQPPPGHAAL
eukprot:1491369-Lingulodinium_polyedra.AAC.1